MRVFEGSSADIGWSGAFEALATDGCLQAGRGGDAKELLHCAITLTNPRARWVLNRVPPINPAFAIAEVVWILSGRDDSSFVNTWNPSLPKYSGVGERYHGAYGRRIRQTFGIDQLDRTIAALSSIPESRQIVLQIWDPAQDFPDNSGRPVDSDIPCNLSGSLKLRNGKLQWLQLMRSNDLIRGTPYNLVQFTMLQEFVAGCVGAECGAYTHVVDSLHAYSTDLNKHGLEPRSPSGPCLKFSLPKKEAFEALCLMERFLLGACQPEAKLRLLKTLLDDLPTAHKSMMLIAAADLARRRKDPELVSALVSECKDPVLSEAWERWNRRCSNQAMSYEYYIA